MKENLEARNDLPYHYAKKNEINKIVLPRACINWRAPCTKLVAWSVLLHVY
jgi:hypothetical protein